MYVHFIITFLHALVETKSEICIELAYIFYHKQMENKQVRAVVLRLRVKFCISILLKMIMHTMMKLMVCI